MRNVQGHGKSLSYYDFGHTTVYAARRDPRCSYCAYIPADYDEDGDKDYPLVVLIHGTARGMTRYRDSFAAFAEAHGVIVLAPLFPVNLCFPGDLSSYKFLRHGGVDYDLILLDMIEEMREKYSIPDRRVMMYGFSGGGHFTHRFLYLHPERLLAASVGAPGMVTLLDQSRDFWVGVRDFQDRFGKALDLDAIRQVPVQLIVGAEDRETWEITIQPDDPLWMPDANIAGIDRNDRLLSLKASLASHGIAVRHDIIPGTAHNDTPMLGTVQEFFTTVLDANRRGLRRPT
ncbi:alpha/beta hydrolase [Gemmobacter serpentinus]|uniref:alpha/beta hydrolase n=1 Tax=Gemmobacter serpentinus TaxID=2652247 RepID=UPI00124E391F|nr:alpha/beta hydrolase [Gemmobacter serpentinus]